MPDTPPAYDRIVPYALPPTLSPSRVSAFTECALAFRFANLDRLPEPPAPHLTRGTLVHLALERLFMLPPAERTPAQAGPCLDAAVAALRDEGELTGLGLDAEGEAAFVAEARRLVDRYITMEDPTAVHAVGLELQLRAEVGGVQLTGIIDRLDRMPDGGFVVVDYKTGSAPSERHERGRLNGVDTYALLCERVLGVLPTAVRLLYLGDGTTLTCVPTAHTTRFVEQKVGAVWVTIQRANAADSFRPKPGRLCSWCSFQTFCPAFGGDPEEGRLLGERLRAERADGERDANVAGLHDEPLRFDDAAAGAAAAAG
jgi:putative RecB family exonuclease